MSVARRFVGWALLGTALISCSSGRVARPAAIGGRDVITQAELDRVTDHSLYDAVQRLRPHFLKNRSIAAAGKPATSPLMLYVDGRKMDSIEELRRLSPTDVSEVRFYEPQAANTKFGQNNNAGGAVAVTLRKTE